MPAYARTLQEEGQGIATYFHYPLALKKQDKRMGQGYAREAAPEDAQLPSIDTSEHWQSALKTVYGPLMHNRAVSSESKNALSLMLGSTHFAALYVGVYGEMPPPALIDRIPKLMRELVHNEAETTRAHLGDDFASLADYAHVIASPVAEIPRDADILEHLYKILPTETHSERKPTIGEDAADGLTTRDFTAAGLAALATFHREILGEDENARVLKPTVNQRAWRWADTAMVALILFTTGHWEDRLWKLYGARLTDRMRANLARYWLALPGTNSFVTRDDPFLAVFLLTLVDWPLSINVE